METESLTLLSKVIFIIENIHGPPKTVAEFKGCILPFINTLAQRPLYTIYNENMTHVILFALREEVSNYLSFIEMPNYRSFSRERHEQTLQRWSPALREHEILLWFVDTEIETRREDIEKHASYLYRLLHY